MKSFKQFIATKDDEIRKIIEVDEPLGFIDFQNKNPGRINLLQREKRGQSSAINDGFNLSKGEILCWLNSDDLLEPSAISIAVDFLNRYKNIDMKYFRLKLIKLGWNSAICLFSSWILLFATKPTTFSSSEKALTISRVWTPTEPVEPNITIFFM